MITGKQTGTGESSKNYYWTDCNGGIFWISYATFLYRLVNAELVEIRIYIFFYLPKIWHFYWTYMSENTWEMIKNTGKPGKDFFTHGWSQRSGPTERNSIEKLLFLFYLLKISLQLANIKSILIKIKSILRINSIRISCI